MKSFKRTLSLFVLILLNLLSTEVFCDFVTPGFPKAYLNDYAGVLNESSRQQLEKTLKSFEEETSNQVFVAIFPSLEGDSLEDASMRLAEKWKVGQKNKDNGVILIVFKNDRKLRIEVGYGLEGVLTDALSKLIIQNEIVPYFKQGDYSAGITAGVSAIFKATKGEYKGKASQKNTGIDFGETFLLLFIILVFFIFPYFVRKGGGRNGVTFGSGSWGGGSGGSGFSGGGGGSFGGGGSSGSW